MALGHLDADEPLPMSALAGALQCDNSNVTGIVDRLEAAGLAERRPAERDRRVIGFFRERGIPVAGVIGGGYSRDIEALARRHSILHRTAAEFV